MVAISQFNLADLHPEARVQFLDLTAKLVEAWTDGETEFLLRPFEGWRSNARQRFLLKRGTTKAGEYLSAHWFGLAVDFVPDLHTRKGPFPSPENAKPHWHWPEPSHKDWRVLGEAAASVGLVQPIKWDKPHIQHPAFDAMRKALRA